MSDANVEKIRQAMVKRTIDALGKNNMRAAWVPAAKDARALVKTLIPQGAVCAVGGSVTLAETGIIDLLRSPDYTFLDRFVKRSPEDRKAFERSTFSADVFLSSANAVTEHGELLFADGHGSRVAPIILGPDKVIIVAGINKIVPDLATGVVRMKKTAAPANAVRLGRDTACAKTGQCMNPACDSRNLMCIPPGACPTSLCADWVILTHQQIADRITVIIVGEELGY